MKLTQSAYIRPHYNIFQHFAEVLVNSPEWLAIDKPYLHSRTFPFLVKKLHLHFEINALPSLFPANGSRGVYPIIQQYQDYIHYILSAQ